MYREFYNRKEALEYLQPNNYMVVKQRNSKGSQAFYIFNTYDDFVSYYEAAPVKTFHEFMGAGPRKIYFDIDVKDGYNIDIILDELHTAMCKTLYEQCNFMEFDTLDVIHCDSSNEHKVSKHIIINNIALSNYEQLQAFYKHTMDKIPDIIIQYIDGQVYKEYQTLRLLHSYKPDDETRVKRVLTKHTFEDTLICKMRPDVRILKCDKHIVNDNTKAWRSIFRIDADDELLDSQHMGMPAMKTMDDYAHYTFDDVEYLLKLLPNENINFGQWFAIGISIKAFAQQVDPMREGDYRDLFVEWTQQYDPSFDGDKYDKFAIKDNREYSLTPLLSMLRKRGHLTGPYKPQSSDGIRPEFKPWSARSNHMLCSQYITGEIDFSKSCFLKSATGTGKTQAIFDHIATHKDTINFMCITNRINLANDINFNMCQKGIQPTFYKDHDFTTNSTPDNLIIQVESLYKLGGGDLSKYNLILIDELMSFIEQLRSPLIKHKNTTINIIMKLLNSNKQGIFTDAYLTNACVASFKASFPHYNKAPFIINTYKNKFNEHVTLCSLDDLMAKYEHALINNKRTVFASDSKRAGYAVHELIKAHDPEARVCIINGDNSMEPAIQKILCNINQELPAYDHFIYSPSIEAGVSFNIPHFHIQFNYFNNDSVSLISNMQAINRVRVKLDNANVICIDKSGVFTPYDKVIENIKFNTMALGENDMLKNFFIPMGDYDEFVSHPISKLLINFSVEKSGFLHHAQTWLTFFLKEQGYKIDDETEDTDNGSILFDDLLEVAQENQVLELVDLARNGITQEGPDTEILDRKRELLIKSAELCSINYGELSPPECEYFVRTYCNYDVLAKMRNFNKYFGGFMGADHIETFDYNIAFNGNLKNKLELCKHIITQVFENIGEILTHEINLIKECKTILGVKVYTSDIDIVKATRTKTLKHMYINNVKLDIDFMGLDFRHAMKLLDFRTEKETLKELQDDKQNITKFINTCLDHFGLYLTRSTIKNRPYYITFTTFI